MAAAPSRGACPPTSLSSTRLTRTSPTLALARRVRTGGAAQCMGPAGGCGVSCPHVACTECCMCPLEGRQVVPRSGSRLRFLTQKQGSPQNPSLRFLTGGVLNARPELYPCSYPRTPYHSPDTIEARVSLHRLARARRHERVTRPLPWASHSDACALPPRTARNA